MSACHRIRLFAAPSLAVLSLAALWPAAALAQAPAPPPAPAAPAPGKPATVEGVTVQAAPQQQAVRASIDRRSYSVSTDLHGAGGSVADALRNIPGAQVDLQGNLTMRGGPVTVMIDGQPSALFSGQAGAQALQAMPADRIDRVEVITNPTAAFSPEGQGGVINLVTKKSAPGGVSGTVRANAGSSGHDNVAGNVAYMKGKLSLAADGGWRRDAQKLQIDTTGTVTDPVTGQADPRTQHEITNAPLNSWNGHVGFDYQLDPKTRLSGEARYNTLSLNRYDDYAFLSAAPGGAPLAAYTRVGENNLSQNTAIGQLTLRRQFPGQDHTLVLFYNHTHTSYQGDAPSTNLTSVPPPSVSTFQDQFGRVHADVDQFKGDYVRPMPKSGQMKAGYDIRNIDAVFNNFGVFGSNPANATLNPAFSNLFHYGQLVSAAYATYEQPMGKWTVLGGLRVEDERLSLNQLTQAVKVERDDVGLFPSLHLAYRASNTTQWILNYSLRIQRPAPQDLNPFRNLTDPFNIRMGNPRLKAEDTNSFEAGWQYRKAATTYLATLFYRQSENGVTDVVADLGNGVLQTTRQNVSSGKTAGLELVAAAPLSKTLTYNVSTNLYWTQIQTPVLGVGQTREAFNAGGRGSINWQPTKNDLVQVNGVINAGRLTAQGTVDPLLILVLGYRHKFTNSFALVAQAQDPFDTVRQYSRLDSPGFDQRTTIRAHIQTFMLGFTYTFGGSGRPQRDPGFDLNPGAPGAIPGG